MKEVYSDLPGVNVQPLRLASQDISGERLLSIMRVDENTRTPVPEQALTHPFIILAV